MKDLVTAYVESLCLLCGHRKDWHEPGGCWTGQNTCDCDEARFTSQSQQVGGKNE